MGRFRPDRLAAFVHTVLDVGRRRNVSFMAGSLAYYAFVAVFPFGALVVFVLALVGSEGGAGRVVGLTGAVLSPQVDAFVQRTVFDRPSSGALSALLVSLVTVVWGAFKLFDGLDTAFSEIYGTPRGQSPVEVLLDGLVLVVTVPLAVVGLGIATVALSVVTVPSVRFATPLTLVCGLALLFVPLYYVFPDVDVSVREVLPGVVVAAVGWMVLQQLFQVYVLVTGVSVGSVVGAVILFLTWLYFASALVLFGGVVNAVHGGYHGWDSGGSEGSRRDRRTTGGARSDETVSDNTP